MTATKKEAQGAEVSHGRYWQPPELRGHISEEGRKWLEENAEAIKSMNEWVEKNGLPLEKYRMF